MSKKVKIIPGCITCGSCEFIAPEIFEITDIARVRKDIDPEKYWEKIQEAVKACPVAVIICKELKNTEKT